MQNLYDEVASLDKRCYEMFHLSEDILMEHAASGMAAYIRTHFQKNTSVVVVAGSGNNGADGIALCRLLHRDFHVQLFLAKEPKSPMAQLQYKRALALGIQECTQLPTSCDVIVDALVGTGFKGEFNTQLAELLEQMNNLKAYKIACDVPSGYRFFADVTLTMGALKKEMFLDKHKAFVGDIHVLDLGVTRNMYETPSNWKLLQYSDIHLPTRKQADTHKGTYGHLCVLSGEKTGASVLSARGAFRFGAGLVTLLGYDNEKTLAIPYELMYAHTLPHNTTAIACGMGLGEAFSKEELLALLSKNIPMVLDADIFLKPALLPQLLQQKNIVLTPHPKEFVHLLKALNLAHIDITTLQENRFEYVALFMQYYPHTTLVLKGANVIIAHKNEYFINPYGTSALAKGGSGDILSGLIGALLAQNYQPLQAAITASLAHTKLAQNYSGADFSLTPNDLIEGIGKL